MGKHKNKRKTPGSGSGSDVSKSDDSTVSTPSSKQPKLTKFMTQPINENANKDTVTTEPETLSTEIETDTERNSVTLEDVIKRIEALENRLESRHKKLVDKLSDEIERLRGDFHELALERENLKKEVSSLKNENDFLRNSLETSKENVNNLEQYTRRENLRIYGINRDNERESADVSEKKVINVLKNKLGLLQIDHQHIAIAHRLGRFQRGRNRPIIVRFISRKHVMDVVSKRRLLKGSGIVIAEDLTKENAQFFTETKKVPGVVQAWTKDGKVFVKGASGVVVPVRRGDNPTELTRKLAGQSHPSNSPSKAHHQSQSTFTVDEGTRVGTEIPSPIPAMTTALKTSTPASVQQRLIELAATSTAPVNGAK